MVCKVNKQKQILLFETFIEGYVSVTTTRLEKNASKSLLCLTSRIELWNTEGGPLSEGSGSIFPRKF